MLIISWGWFLYKQIFMIKKFVYYVLWKYLHNNNPKVMKRILGKITQIVDQIWSEYWGLIVEEHNMKYWINGIDLKPKEKLIIKIKLRKKIIKTALTRNRS